MVYTFGDPVWVARTPLTLARFVLYAVFLAVGGAALGSVLGGHVSVARRTQETSVIILALVAWLLAVLRLRKYLPQVRRQVPVQLSRRKWSGPIIFGLILGAGVLTYIPSSTMYVYLGAVALGPRRDGIVAGIFFGLTYGLVTLVASYFVFPKSAIDQTRVLSRLGRRSEPVILLAVVSVAAYSWVA